MSRNIIFSPEEYCHCYGRGTEKRKIFLNRKDHERFTHLLFVCNSKNTIHLSDYGKKSFDDIFDIDRNETLVDIGAYCLMSNHFHLLIREKEDGNLSLFMQKLMTGYTMYFNKKYDRTGSLFESRFRAQHVDGDEHLKYLFSYINLNPVKMIDSNWKEEGIKNKIEAKKFLQEYIYSSYLDYLGYGRAQKIILNREAFPDYFPNKEDFEEEIYEWLTYVKVEP